MTSLGSTAMTYRSSGSYDPVPAPTFTTDRASPSASRMADEIRGSSRRVREYSPPIRSYRAISLIRLPPHQAHPPTSPHALLADPSGAIHGATLNRADQRTMTNDGVNRESRESTRLRQRHSPADAFS